MKKYLTMGIIAILTISLFVACGVKNSNQNIDDNKQEIEDVVTPDNNDVDKDDIQEESKNEENDTNKDDKDENKPNSSNDDVKPQVKPQTTPDVQEPEVKPQVKPEVSVSTLMDTVLNTLGDEKNQLVVMDESIYSNLYQMSSSDFEEILIYAPQMSVRATEVAIIKTSGNVNAAKAILENRKANLIKQWETYLPEQYEMVKKSKIVTNGNYVALIVAENVNAAVDSFNQSLK